MSEYFGMRKRDRKKEKKKKKKGKVEYSVEWKFFLFFICNIYKGIWIWGMFYLNNCNLGIYVRIYDVNSNSIGIL